MAGLNLDTLDNFLASVKIITDEYIFVNSFYDGFIARMLLWNGPDHCFPGIPNKISAMAALQCRHRGSLRELRELKR